MWRNPNKEDRGFCRVRPHETKLWDSGWTITGYSEIGDTFECRNNAQPHRPLWFKAKNVEVPI